MGLRWNMDAEEERKVMVLKKRFGFKQNTELIRFLINREVERGGRGFKPPTKEAKN